MGQMVENTNTMLEGLRLTYVTESVLVSVSVMLMYVSSEQETTRNYVNHKIMECLGLEGTLGIM